MNYELALQMKEAGFPFTAASLADQKYGMKMFNCGLDSLGRKGTWLYPTLEEVIEALPIKVSTNKRFTNDEHKIEHAHSLSFHLSTIHESKTDFKWYAGFSHSSLPDTCHILKTGATPLEAVCRLWLELNRKI